MTIFPSHEEVLKNLRTWLRNNANHPNYDEMDTVRKELGKHGQSALEKNAAKLRAIGLLPGAPATSASQPPPAPRPQPATTPLNRLNVFQPDNTAAAKPQDSTPIPDRAEAVRRILSGVRRDDYLTAYKNALIARNQGVLTVQDRGNALGFGENAAPEITKVIAKLEFALPLKLKNYAYSVLDTVQKIKSNNPEAAQTQIAKGLAHLQDDDLPESIREQLEGSVLLLERERDEIQKLLAQATAPVDEQQNQAEWQSKVQAVRDLLDQKTYREALGLLDKILLEVKDTAWQSEFEPLRQQARDGWMNQVKESVERAERTEKHSPDDLQAQERDWQAVLDLDPQHEAARLFFKQRLPDRKNEIKYRKTLSRLRTNLQLAVSEDAKDPLITLRNLLTECDALESEMRDSLYAEQILQTLLKEWRTTKSQIEQGREQVRARLGEMSTLIASGDYTKAYQQGLQALRDGKTTLTDTANLTGRGANAEVSANEFVILARGKLFAFLRQKAAEHREQAVPYKITKPETAERLLKEAIGFLSRKEQRYLTRDDETALEPDRVPIERELEETQRNLSAYQQAVAKIRKAQAMDNTEQMRRLASEARQEYPEHSALPGLAELETRIQALQIAEQAELLRQARGQSNQQRENGKYTDALEILQKARGIAIRQVPIVPTGSALEQILHELDQDERSIYVEQTNVTQAEQAVAIIRQFIKDGDIRSAQQHHQNLKDEIKQLTQVKQLRQELTYLQSDEEKFKSGSHAYQNRKWQEAESDFNAVTQTHPKYQEAQTLARRAKAAQHCLDGDKAYTKNQVEEALNAYQAALGIFEDTPDPYDASALLAQGTGVDPETRNLYQQCQRRVEELRPMQQATAEILPKLKETQQLLKASKERLKHRSTLLARLEALPELQRAARILENEVEPRAAHSTKNSEFQSILGEVRRTWHDVYLKPSPQADKSALAEAAEQNDFDVLLRARLRVEELYAAGLIAEREDQQTYAKLRLRYLDCEYESLIKQNPDTPLDARGTADLPDWYLPAQRSNPREVDWQLVENNRQSALQIGGKYGLFRENQRGKIYAVYADAARKRLQAELTQTTSTQIKQEKLREALNTEPLQSNRDLLEQLLNLYWQQQQWQAAEQAALQYEPAEIWRAIWVGLTKMQCAYAQGDIEDAREQTKRLDAKKSSLSGEEKQKAQKKIDDYAQSIEVRLLEQWHEDARALEKSNLQNNWIEAAQIYARILQLDKHNSAAQQSLKRLGDHLSPQIAELYQQAISLKIEQQQLADAVRAASKLCDAIKQLRAAVEKMNFSVEDDKEKFTQADEIAHKKYDRWNTALRLKREFEEKVSTAKNKPISTRKTTAKSGTSTEAESIISFSGGWDFSEASRILTDFQQKLPLNQDDDNLKQVHTALQQQLENDEETAKKLWDPIKQLLIALETQDFDKVMVESDNVEKIWKSVTHQGQNWDGLKSILRRYADGQCLETTDAIKKWAATQKRNTETWETWQKQVEQLHQAIKLSRQKYTNLWSGDAEKRLEVEELAKLAELYKNIADQYTKLHDLLNSAPEASTQTNSRTREIQDNAPKLADIRHEKTNIEKFKAEVDDRLKKYNQILLSLRAQMTNIENLKKKARGKPIAEQAIRLARTFLEELKENNPLQNNQEIKVFQKTLDELSKPPSKFSTGQNLGKHVKNR